jgi:hypothetical protein
VSTFSGTPAVSRHVSASTPSQTPPRVLVHGRTISETVTPIALPARAEIGVYTKVVSVDETTPTATPAVDLPTVRLPAVGVPSLALPVEGLSQDLTVQSISLPVSANTGADASPGWSTSVSSGPLSVSSDARVNGSPLG